MAKRGTNADDMTPLQRLIRDQMQRKGWDAPAVEARGISHSTLHRYLQPLWLKTTLRDDTVNTLAAVLDLDPEHARGMAVVAAQTGLRQGELLGLRLRDVDFLRGLIHVSQQLVEAPRQPAFGPPKTAAGVRTVPLPALAKEALAAHIAAFPSPEGEPLFLTQRGRRWRRSAFGESWRVAKNAAELPEWAHWHALRDVFASACIESGMTVKTVMTLLGHATSDETLRTYARVWPDAHDDARKRLDLLWSQSSDDHKLTDRT